MYSLKFSIQTQAPLLLQARNGDANTVSSLNYIPGYVILGALAGHYIRSHALHKSDKPAHCDADFSEYFLSGALRFLPAYPIWQNGHAENYRSLPMPLSIQSEKDNDNKLYDLLYAEPEQLTKAESGFMYLQGNSLFPVQTQMQLTYHHGRRKDAPGEEPVPFTYESLGAGQQFEGLILGNETLLTAFKEQLPESLTLFLGRSRNAQYGETAFQWLGSPSAFETELIKYQLPDLEEESDREVSLTLLSDTLLLNDFGLPSLSKETVEQYLQTWIPGCQIQKAFIRESETENFVSVWGLRKPAQTYLQAGSCFLLKIPEHVDFEQAARILHQNGLGERVHEGFGRVALGLQYHEQLQKEQTSQQPLKRPEHPIPEATRRILEHAIHQHLHMWINNRALNKANTFKNIPPKALLGRLEDTLKHTDMLTFQQQVNTLKDTAQKHLSRCKNEHQNLWLFLTGAEHNPIEGFQQIPFIQNLVRALDQHKDVLPDLEAQSDNLKKQFWLTFLAGLRKQAKLKGDSAHD